MIMEPPFITMTSKWARWRLKSPASWLFTQPFIQAQIKANIKAPRHWPLWREFTGDRWILLTKDQQWGKWIHFMTSSCTKKLVLQLRAGHTRKKVFHCEIIINNNDSTIMIMQNYLSSVIYQREWTALNRPVSQIRAPSGGLSQTSGKLWQDYWNCYRFWT